MARAKPGLKKNRLGLDPGRKKQAQHIPTNYNYATSTHSIYCPASELHPVFCNKYEGVMKINIRIYMKLLLYQNWIFFGPNKASVKFMQRQQQLRKRGRRGKNSELTTLTHKSATRSSVLPKQLLWHRV